MAEYLLFPEECLCSIIYADTHDGGPRFNTNKDCPVPYHRATPEYWYKHYWDCVESHQRQGAEMAEIEDALFDEAGYLVNIDGSECEELIDCIRALTRQRDEYKELYAELCE